MRKPAPRNLLNHLHASDLRGLAQLATQATVGVTRIAEGVHQSVWDTLGVPGGAPGQTGGVTGVVYQTVHGLTRLVGRGVSTVLARLEPLLESVVGTPAGTPEREAVLAALNGVMGDRLVADRNPLAAHMTVRFHGEALHWRGMPPTLPSNGQVLLLIHGLCMNDLQWHTGQGVDHGLALADALGCVPLYLRYNSGLHISQNGHELAEQLEQMLAHWPVPLEQLTVVAHSMGGLLIRSAVHYARLEGLRWPRCLKHIVFLGTPHHGAPLERAGRQVDAILDHLPYTAPFARLGRLRSAGITDLRYGFVLDTDWVGKDRFQRTPDRRQHVPLPEGVACFTIAATTAAKRGALADRLIGDRLVPLRSALGQHDDPRRNLVFAKDSQWIAYRTSHLDLLSDPAVTQRMLRWLVPQQLPPT